MLTKSPLYDIVVIVKGEQGFSNSRYKTLKPTLVGSSKEYSALSHLTDGHCYLMR